MTYKSKHWTNVEPDSKMEKILQASVYMLSKDFPSLASKVLENGYFITMMAVPETDDSGYNKLYKNMVMVDFERTMQGVGYELYQKLSHKMYQEWKGYGI